MMKGGGGGIFRLVNGVRDYEVFGTAGGGQVWCLGGAVGDEGNGGCFWSI